MPTMRDSMVSGPTRSSPHNEPARLVERSTDDLIADASSTELRPSGNTPSTGAFSPRRSRAPRRAHHHFVDPILLEAIGRNGRQIEQLADRAPGCSPANNLRT